MGILQPLYYTPFIKYIKNDFRLPIIFFDACLTAKLDFNITDLKEYYIMVYQLQFLIFYQVIGFQIQIFSQV